MVALSDAAATALSIYQGSVLEEPETLFILISESTPCII